MAPVSHEQNLADIAAIYDACHRDFSEATVRFRSAQGTEERDRFLASLPEHPSILDLGFGSGWDMEYFSERGARVAGVDICAAQVEAVRSLVPDTDCVVGDIARADEYFPAESFDGIWACAAIVHMDREASERMFRAMHRLLRFKGRGYCSTKVRLDPNAPEVAQKASVSSGWILKRYVYWLPDDLLASLERSGFTIESHSFSSMNSGDTFLRVFFHKS